MNEDNTFDVEKMKKAFRHVQARNPELYSNITKILDECKAEGKYINIVIIISLFLLII